MVMPCGHPAGCWLDNHDGNRCLWCEEIESLKRDVAALTEQLTRNACIVTGGHPTFVGVDSIGYLAVSGGSVSFKDKTITSPLSDVAYKGLVGAPIGDALFKRVWRWLRHWPNRNALRRVWERAYKGAINAPVRDTFDRLFPGGNSPEPPMDGDVPDEIGYSTTALPDSLTPEQRNKITTVLAEVSEACGVRLELFVLRRELGGELLFTTTDTLSESDKRQIKEAWKRAYEGTKSAHKTVSGPPPDMRRIVDAVESGAYTRDELHSMVFAEPSDADVPVGAVQPTGPEPTPPPPPPNETTTKGPKP